MRTHVINFCRALSAGLEDPTIQPTVRPSADPSVTPTWTATATPSQLPTLQPTLKPSPVPTVLVPSAAPSEDPTPLMPVAAATTPPSAVPTSTPTMFPTPLPSPLAPTAAPSAMPSVTPSMPPTCSPTPQPSVKPSATPTLSPTLGGTDCTEYCELNNLNTVYPAAQIRYGPFRFNRYFVFSFDMSTPVLPAIGQFANIFLIVDSELNTGLITMWMTSSGTGYLTYNGLLVDSSANLFSGNYQESTTSISIKVGPSAYEITSSRTGTHFYPITNVDTYTRSYYVWVSGFGQTSVSGSFNNLAFQGTVPRIETGSPIVFLCVVVMFLGFGLPTAAPTLVPTTQPTVAFYNCQVDCALFSTVPIPVIYNTIQARISLPRNFLMTFSVQDEEFADPAVAPVYSILELRDESTNLAFISIGTGSASSLRVLYRSILQNPAGPMVTASNRLTTVYLQSYNGVLTFYTSNDTNNVFTYDVQGFELPNVQSKTFALYLSNAAHLTAGGVFFDFQVQGKLRV